MAVYKLRASSFLTVCMAMMIYFAGRYITNKLQRKLHVLIQTYYSSGKTVFYLSTRMRVVKGFS